MASDTVTNRLQSIVGKRVVRVVFSKVDCFGKPAGDGEILVRAIDLDDGTTLVFQGSGQIGVDDVWMDIEHH
jgi:hypothetical protein